MTGEGMGGLYFIYFFIPLLDNFIFRTELGHFCRRHYQKRKFQPSAKKGEKETRAPYLKGLNWTFPSIHFYNVTLRLVTLSAIFMKTFPDTSKRRQCIDLSHYFLFLRRREERDARMKIYPIPSRGLPTDRYLREKWERWWKDENGERFSFFHQH